MALNFNQLIQIAEQIRTNTLPDSNTADLVGGHLKDILNFFNDIMKGTGDNASAYEYAFIKHSSFQTFTSLDEWLTTILGYGEDQGLKYDGVIRTDIQGHPVLVLNFILSWADKYWLQAVIGGVGVDASSHLTSSADFNIVWRNKTSDGTKTWQDFGRIRDVRIDGTSIVDASGVVNLDNIGEELMNKYIDPCFKS